MRKLIKSLVAVSVLTAMATVAQAGDIGYTTGDLLLNFRQWNSATATPGTLNYTFDIGTFSAKYSGQANVTVGTFDLGSIGSGMNNIQFSIVGGSIAGIGPTAITTEFMSKSRIGAATNPSVQGTEAAWAPKTGSLLEQSRSRFEPVGTHALLVGTPDSDGYSYHTAVGNNGDFATKFQGTVETTVAVGSTVYADLFTMTGKSTTASSSVSYSGVFQVVDNGNNTVTVTYNAVPEPATFGVLAAAGLLLVSTRRQLRKQA